RIVAVRASCMEEQFQRESNWPPGSIRKISYAEREMRRRLARRRIHKPQLAAIRNEADRDTAVTQQAFKFGCRRVVPCTSRGFWFVQIDCREVRRVIGKIPNECDDR